jgi:hypothetical protein
MYYLSLPVNVYSTVSTELGTEKRKTERQSTQTINIRQPTSKTRNQQQPPTGTCNNLQWALHPTTNNKQQPLTGTPTNLQWALYNQPDNQRQTTTTDRDTHQSTVAVLQAIRQPATNNCHWQLTIKNSTRPPKAKNRQVLKKQTKM